MPDYASAFEKVGLTPQQSRKLIAQMQEAGIDLSHATDLAQLALSASAIAEMDSAEAFEQMVTNCQAS